MKVDNLRPTEGKTERGIAEPRSVTSETSRHGEPSSHLAKSGHDQVDDPADESVRDEDRARAGLRESLTGSDDETCSDSTADSNHSNVTGFKTAM